MNFQLPSPQLLWWQNYVQSNSKVWTPITFSPLLKSILQLIFRTSTSNLPQTQTSNSLGIKAKLGHRCQPLGAFESLRKQSKQHGRRNAPLARSDRSPSQAMLCGGRTAASRRHSFACGCTGVPRLPQGQKRHQPDSETGLEQAPQKNSDSHGNLSRCQVEMLPPLKCK